jgi:DNA (cytosine-5)-methyltransferase 1
LNELTHIDLFSGIGGFSLAAEWAGFRTIAFCEIEPFCQEVLKKHWPDIPIWDYVKTFKWGGERPTLLTGGFPCQDLSSAGQRAGIDGERSGLWGELFRVMCEIRPRFTLIENVNSLVTGDDGLWFQRLLSDLAEGGFNVEWECIPASSIGAPHHRDRVYLVAYPNENGWLRLFAKINFKVRRNLGNNIGSDWFGCGEGAWSNWETETREKIFSQSIIVGDDDGISSGMDRNS